MRSQYAVFLSGTKTSKLLTSSSLPTGLWVIRQWFLCPSMTVITSCQSWVPTLFLFFFSPCTNLHRHWCFTFTILNTFAPWSPRDPICQPPPSLSIHICHTCTLIQTHTYTKWHTDVCMLVYYFYGMFFFSYGSGQMHIVWNVLIQWSIIFLCKHLLAVQELSSVVVYGLLIVKTADGVSQCLGWRLPTYLGVKYFLNVNKFWEFPSFF